MSIWPDVVEVRKKHTGNYFTVGITYFHIALLKPMFGIQLHISGVRVKRIQVRRVYRVDDSESGSERPHVSR